MFADVAIYAIFGKTFVFLTRYMISAFKYIILGGISQINLISMFMQLVENPYLPVIWVHVVGGKLKEFWKVEAHWEDKNRQNVAKEWTLETLFCISGKDIFYV